MTLQKKDQNKGVQAIRHAKTQPTKAVSKFMKKILLLIAAASLSIQCLAVSLTNRDVLNGLISIDIPTEFTPLDQETLALKFPRTTPPEEGYSNDNASVTIVFRLKTGSPPMTINDLRPLQTTMTKAFNNLKIATRWHQNKIMKINGHDWLVLEFTSPAIDTPIRNLMVVTAVDGKLVAASFNTSSGQAKKWMPVGRKMINSIRTNASGDQP